MKEYCICGHPFCEHFYEFHGYPQIGKVCIGCQLANDVNTNHYFKLDNLKLIEDLAKERNLL
jgi:hypothetical protein